MVLVAGDFVTAISDPESLGRAVAKVQGTQALKPLVLGASSRQHEQTVRIALGQSFVEERVRQVAQAVVLVGDRTDVVEATELVQGQSETGWPGPGEKAQLCHDRIERGGARPAQADTEDFWLHPAHRGFAGHVSEIKVSTVDARITSGCSGRLAGPALWSPGAIETPARQVPAVGSMIATEISRKAKA